MVNLLRDSKLEHVEKKILTGDDLYYGTVIPAKWVLHTDNTKTDEAVYMYSGVVGLNIKADFKDCPNDFYLSQRFNEIRYNPDEITFKMHYTNRMDMHSLFHLKMRITIHNDTKNELTTVYESPLIDVLTGDHLITVRIPTTKEMLKKDDLVFTLKILGICASYDMTIHSCGLYKKSRIIAKKKPGLKEKMMNVLKWH